MLLQLLLLLTQPGDVYGAFTRLDYPAQDASCDRIISGGDQERTKALLKAILRAFLGLARPAVIETGLSRDGVALDESKPRIYVGIARSGNMKDMRLCRTWTSDLPRWSSVPLR